jgi:hypothetical protein
MDANHQVVAGKNLRQRKAYCPRCSRSMGVLDLMCYECGFSFPAEQIALSAHPAVRRWHVPPTVKRLLPWIVSLELIVVWIFCLCAAGAFKPQFGRSQTVKDEPFIDIAALSCDLERDKASMWGARCDSLCAVGFSPPISAVNSANRVFSTAYLIGLTSDEVSIYLAEPPSRLLKSEDENSREYSFFAEGREKRVGWRFTLHFGIDGRVCEVSRAAY